MKKNNPLSYQEFAALTPEEQAREERIAIIIEGDHCTEDEARARVERRQRDLFGKE